MQVASKKPSESPRAQRAGLEGLARGAKGGVGSEAAAKPAAPRVPMLDRALPDLSATAPTLVETELLLE